MNIEIPSPSPSSIPTSPEVENPLWAFVASEQEALQDHEVRRRALDVLKSSEVPNRRFEEWKYTDLRMRLPALFTSTKPCSENRTSLPYVLPSTHLTLEIVNGHLATSHINVLAAAGIHVQTTPHVAISPVGEQILINPASTFPYALNTALAPETISITIQKNITQPLVLHMRTATVSSSATYPRIEWTVAPDVSCTILEIHEGPNTVDYQINSFSQWILGQGSSVTHSCLHRDGDCALVLATQGISLGAQASFESVQISLGGAYTRATTWATFQGEKAHLALRGSSLLRGTQHHDTTLFIDHAVPECTSEEFFKTIVDDNATGVFQGKVIVEQKAQKTDGKMLSAALLLSDNAAMNNKPELEIFADDVRCGHGATCGALDEDALFYIRSRGLAREDAEALLLGAFVSDVFDHIHNESIHAFLSEAVVGWLAHRQEMRDTTHKE